MAASSLEFSESQTYHSFHSHQTLLHFSSRTHHQDQALMAPPPSSTSTVSLKASKRARLFYYLRLSLKHHEPSPSPSGLPPPSNSLLGLPAEIKRLIFESLADIPSLRALISTCSTLYCSFHDSESSILAGFLQTRIPPSLMYPALATLKSSKPTPWSRQTAEDLITLYTKTGKASLLPELNLRNALLLSEMHDHVHFFATRFATYALSQHPVAGVPQLVSPPISPSELCRIERTLYRFQCYCNLMTWRNTGLSNRCRISSVISDNFAPWENEQLACIINYLVDAAFKGTCFIICAYSRQTADRSIIPRHTLIYHSAGNT